MIVTYEDGDVYLHSKDGSVVQLSGT
jgi:hypothetical protein